MPPKTYVYVDGFNLYYGAVKDTPYKWLNIRRLCDLLLPAHSIARIKYFTARVSARKDDPDKPTRQQIYLRALRTLPDLEIVYGSFLSHDVMLPLTEPSPGGPRFARVTRTEEKGSDVNIAAHLVYDAYQHNFAAAVLVTNDSDLLEPIRIVRHELRLDVGILNPHRHTPSRVLTKHASFIKQIREGSLKSSQFPQTLQDAHGEFHKPGGW
ncbi:MAG TPA: NYN domain-containing protein [Thermoleophilia bacterium]|nr:NYN domain-containing protein [Thermoleophilia bacterium]